MIFIYNIIIYIYIYYIYIYIYIYNDNNIIIVKLCFEFLSGNKYKAKTKII